MDRNSEEMQTDPSTEKYRPENNESDFRISGPRRCILYGHLIMLLTELIPKQVIFWISEDWLKYCKNFRSCLNNFCKEVATKNLKIEAEEREDISGYI